MPTSYTTSWDLTARHCPEWTRGPEFESRRPDRAKGLVIRPFRVSRHICSRPCGDQLVTKTISLLSRLA
jgi:hypothetical protein